MSITKPKYHIIFFSQTYQFSFKPVSKNNSKKNRQPKPGKTVCSNLYVTIIINPC